MDEKKDTALTSPSEIKRILSAHEFSFSKGLGQNFLINPSVCPRMADSCIRSKNTGVLEIGPGIGVLTKELARRAEKVVALELDGRLLPVLKETLGEFGNVKIIHGDAMKEDLAALIEREFAGMNVSACANLPYYITSSIIMRLLEEDLPLTDITVMVQREAAERICALPGTREAGAISLAVRFFCEPEILFSVSRGSFMPAPKVDSAVIKLSLRGRDLSPDIRRWYFRLVRAAFTQRRKTVLNSISGSLGLPKERVEGLLRGSEINPGARAEQISLEQFVRLAEGFESDLNVL